MNANSMNNLFSLIALLFGAYCLYAWNQLKSGKIPEKFMLLSRDLPPEKCLDQEYYTAYMRPRLLIFGIIIVLSGIIGLVDVHFGIFRTLFGDQGYIAGLILTSVIPFASVVWFAVCLMKIQKELW